MIDFNNHVAIVTGAGSGIGAATARRFHEEGASVVMIGRTEAKLRKAAEGLAPERVLIQPGDVSHEDEVAEMVEAAARHFGKLDTLVNNAGVATSGPTAELSMDDWRRVMSVDVDGVFLMTRAALPHLIKAKGSVVNVSSVSGLGGDWEMSAYNAAKGAVTNFTRSLALELGGKGVRVNAVNPALTRSELTESMLADDGLVKKFAERMPLGAPAEPEAVADAILFLASRAARFVTGVNLPVDGGCSASNGQPPQ